MAAVIYLQIATKREWRDPDSNRGHHDFQSCALPTELSRQGAVLWLTNRVFVIQSRSHWGPKHTPDLYRPSAKGIIHILGLHPNTSRRVSEITECRPGIPSRLSGTGCACPASPEPSLPTWLWHGSTAGAARGLRSGRGWGLGSRQKLSEGPRPASQRSEPSYGVLPRAPATLFPVFLAEDTSKQPRSCITASPCLR